MGAIRFFVSKNTPERSQMVAPCKLDDCENPKLHRGYCTKHYQRFMKWGDPSYTQNVPGGATLRERLEHHGWDVLESGCWKWRGKLDQKFGYGRLKDGLSNTSQPAHRVSYRVFVGDIPEGLVIRHKCDNPWCVNPDHLEPGTVADNMADMRIRGRATRGSDVNTSKLSKEQVLEIRRRRLAGDRGVDLAKEFNVTKTNISNICNGRIWKWLPLNPLPSAAV